MAYTRINWENLPSTNTPVNATNLNIMDAGIANLDTNKLDKAVNVTTASTNLNNYKSDGEFYFGSSYTPTNIPAGTNGWLKVITGVQGNDNIVKQIWYRHGTPDSTDYDTYVRTFSSNSWGNWRRFVTEAENLSVTSHMNAGSVTAFRMGNLIIVNIRAGKTLASSWTDYDAVTISNFTAKVEASAPIVDQNTGLCADIFISANSNVVKINKRNVSGISDGYFRGQLVFVAN